MPTVSLSRAVLEADIIISLPKFKTHGLTIMTGAIKNSYGFLPGAQKARLHKAAGSPARFHEMIVDVFRLRVPDLFIVDAVVGMEGNGPASTELRDIGLILASDNAVALDAVIATMMGCDPARLGFLRKAKSVGLGTVAYPVFCGVGKPDSELSVNAASIQRTANRQSAFIQNMGVNHCRCYVFMPQQLLNRPNVVSAFKQMCCKTVAEGMATYHFADFGFLRRRFHRTL